MKKIVKPSIHHIFDRTVDIMARQFSIPRGRFPKLVINKGKGARYEIKSNKVYYGASNGDAETAILLGEEVAHFVRAHKRGISGKEFEEGSEHADEFLGFLGSRIVYHDLSYKERKFLFPLGEPSIDKVFPKGRGPYLKYFEGWGKTLSPFNKAYLESQRRRDRATMHKIEEVVKNLGIPKMAEVRNNFLTHYRPYYYASQVDLDRIGDYSQLFSLPEREIRHRFFRADPKYRVKGTIERKLEKAVDTMLLVLLPVFILFLVGNIHYNSNVTASVAGDFLLGNLLGVIVFVLIIAFVYFKVRKIRD